MGSGMKRLCDKQSYKWLMLLYAVVCIGLGCGAGAQENRGPWNDPADLTLWPNHTSHANSDAWLAENHDRIRRMNPRVMLVNFSNEHGTNHLLGLARRLIDILAESSRYHGYKDSNA